MEGVQYIWELFFILHRGMTGQYYKQLGGKNCCDLQKRPQLAFVRGVCMDRDMTQVEDNRAASVGNIQTASPAGHNLRTAFFDVETRESVLSRRRGLRTASKGGEVVRTFTPGG
jgi:hypothetical protein